MFVVGRRYFAIEQRLCVLCKRDDLDLALKDKKTLPDFPDFVINGYVLPGDRNYLMRDYYQLHIFESRQSRDNWIEKRNKEAWRICDNHKYLTCEAYPIRSTKKSKAYYIGTMEYNHTFFRLWDDAKSLSEYYELRSTMLDKLREPIKLYGNEYAIRYLEREYEREKLIKA